MKIEPLSPAKIFHGVLVQHKERIDACGFHVCITKLIKRVFCVFAFLAGRSSGRSLGSTERGKSCFMHYKDCASSFAGVEISNQIANFVYSLLRRVCGAVAGNGESLPRFQQKCIQVAEAAAALIMSDNGRRQ